MKKLLFLTYYFPPSGGPGVQRSLKFVKYLTGFGWHVTVVTVDPQKAAYPDVDAGLESEIPEGIDLVRTSSRDPYAAYARLMGKRRDSAVGVSFLGAGKVGAREKLARWIRANLFIPDARIGWNGYAERAATQILGRTPHDAMLSTGPPHSTHLVARSLHRKHKLPWVLDLRDAWPPDSFAHLLPTTKYARRRDEAIRESAFGDADLIITVSDALADDCRRLTDTRVDVIHNGFDPDDFEAVRPVRDDDFTIVYTGNLAAEQNPVALWHAVKQFNLRNRERSVCVRLVGHVAGEVLAAVEQAGLRRAVEIVPYVEHREAIRFMCGAGMLLLCINRVPNPEGIVTGKLYEYLASSRPVLCLSPGETEAGRIVRETGAGEVFGYEDAGGVLETLERHVDGWTSGNPSGGAERERIIPYSRKSQAEALARMLNNLTEEPS